ncbi:hypothetical protein ACFQVD_07455 [Streptosporangium amethystogenes subsp. fukuiense]|uniref:Uncharacterized protein n=1 Tax=Streptosporangium amethystogenes subsp. fukuiense TaxID=698418 RepID=A0ABW2SUH4_9ACTN
MIENTVGGHDAAGSVRPTPTAVSPELIRAGKPDMSGYLDVKVA